MHEFFTTFARKIFSRNLGAHTPYPRLLRLWAEGRKRFLTFKLPASCMTLDGAVFDGRCKRHVRAVKRLDRSHNRKKLVVKRLAGSRTIRPKSYSSCLRRSVIGHETGLSRIYSAGAFSQLLQQRQATVVGLAFPFAFCVVRDALGGPLVPATR